LSELQLKTAQIDLNLNYPIEDILCVNISCPAARIKAIVDRVKIDMLRVLIAVSLTLVLTITSMPSARAFCGFYVAGVDAKLFNRASQVIIARNGNNTILTMANDFQGDVKDFAMVVPVPVGN
jgi:hypothetical protein